MASVTEHTDTELLDLITQTALGTPTQIRTAEGTPTNRPTAQGTPTQILTAEGTPTNTPTAQGTPTQILTTEGTPTNTPTAQGTPTQILTAKGTPTNTPTAHGTPTQILTAEGTPTNTPTAQGTLTKPPTAQTAPTNLQTVQGTPTKTQTAQGRPTNTTETCDNEQRNLHIDEDMEDVAVGVIVNEQISAIPEVETENEHISTVLEGSTSDEHSSAVADVNTENAAIIEMDLEHKQTSTLPYVGNKNEQISAISKMSAENETMLAVLEVDIEKAVIFEVDMEYDQVSEAGTENEHISIIPDISGTENEQISTISEIDKENEQTVTIPHAGTVNQHTPVVYIAETANDESADVSEADKVIAKPASILEDRTVNTQTSIVSVNEHISAIPELETGKADVHLKLENVTALPALVQTKPQADLTSAAYKIDVELVAMLSKAETINLVHEYRTELESTKKKLERSERQLGKANDYNGVLRNMVEKLSGELHRVKHVKTCSVHVQVEKDDFLEYTTGSSTMPNWQSGDDHSSVPMDISLTDEPKENHSPVVYPSHGMETETVSIADSIKQAAQAVVQQQHTDLLQDSGYVYDEQSGLYYHSTSGYYYDQNKSLFYDPKSGIYYYFDYDNGKYVFHSKVELSSKTEGVDKSAVNVDIPFKKKHAEPRTKQSKKTQKKNRTRESNSEEEKMFKNRQERRKFQIEEQSRKRRPRRNDKYDGDGSRGKGEKGRKRRRGYSSGDDQGRSSSQRDRNTRSPLPHSNDHRSLSPHGKDKIRKKDGATKYRSRSRDGHKYRYRKLSRTSESESVDSDVQIIEPQCVESTNTDHQIKGRKSLDQGGKKTNALPNVDGIIRSKSDAYAKALLADGTDAVRNSDRGNPVKSSSDIHNESKAKSVIIIDNDDDYELESETELMIIEDGTSEAETDIIDTERKGEKKEEKDKPNDDRENINKAETEIEIELEGRQKNDIYQSSKQSHRRSRSRKNIKHHHKRKSEDRVADPKEDKLNSDTGSEIESGELTDSNTEQSCYSESDGHYSNESSTEDMNDLEIVEIVEQEVAETYPPCIRVMAVESDCLMVGTLFIVTCTGAKIGRENCDICIPDLNISKLHADIRYNEGSRQYELFDLASQNGTFLNNQRLSPAKIASEAIAVSHDDHMLVGGTNLLCHIHPGSDTCDECEPGVVIATHKAQQPEIKVLSKEERMLQKKQEMNQIKKRYGLKNSAYEDNKEVFTNPNYTDKAEERRRTVGSDVPGQKQEAPASVHRPLSTGNVGHKMLQKMGWKEGDALGKNNSGIQEPISVTLRASQTAGLGSASAGKFSADDANTVDMKKASRRIQAQQRYKQIETKKSQSSADNTDKQWTHGDTEYT